MSTPKSFYFDRFCLEPANARLLRDGQSVPLAPKTFELLTYFCRHPERLVRKEELLDAVWPRRFVSEGVLKTAVQELRKVLGDNPKTARYIETVHRRGYRFIAEVRTEPPTTETSADNAEGGLPLVGREPVLHSLEHWLGQSLNGTAQTVFLSGEAGIGKTTAIRAFVQHAAAHAVCIQGQCVEHYGRSEPYLPLLEAINQLAAQSGDAGIRQLRRFAPTWLAQLPWLIDDSDRDHLQREIHGVTKERMLRELGELLRHWTDTQPLLLEIEDLHWSDPSTLDALSYLSRRRDGARLMILGSYRTADVAVNRHAFHVVRGELLVHGLCHDLPLSLLTRRDVGDYLRRRFAGERLADATVDSIYRRTEGLPLFLDRIADEMAAARSDPAVGSFERILATLPEGLRHLIDLQFERLSERQRQWLEVAAVCGDGFFAAVLAEVTVSSTPTEVEAWCEQQVRAHHLLRYAEESGDIGMRSATRYAFIHTYYQEQAYACIAPVRRAQLHARVGDWLEALYGTRAGELAAELALHFVHGERYEQAVRYLYLAACNALRRHASREAVDLLQQALAILDRHLTELPDYLPRALELHGAMAPAMLAMQGFASAELKTVYDRALDMARQLGHPPSLFGVLWGGWLFYFIRAELHTAHACGQQLLQAAQRAGDELGQVAGHLALSASLLDLCDLAGALRHVRQALALYDFERDAQACSHYAQDLGAAALSKYCVLLKLLGRVDEALQQLETALVRAEQLGQPFTLAIVLMEKTSLHLDRREIPAVLSCSTRLEQLAAGNDLPLMYAFALIYRGWALAAQGRGEEGIAIMQQAAEPLALTGTHVLRPYYMTLTAEACLMAGRIEDGLSAVTAAMSAIEEFGVRQFQAETHRILGELLWAKDGGNAVGVAESSLCRALEVAKEQGFRLYVLRAGTALSRFWEARGDRAKAKQLFDEIRAECTKKSRESVLPYQYGKMTVS
ncbi:MAG: AAA family ATPase [Gammaproteobacteria bacterium]